MPTSWPSTMLHWSRSTTKGHAVSGLSSPIEAAIATGKLHQIVRALSMGVEHMRVLAHIWAPTLNRYLTIHPRSINATIIQNSHSTMSNQKHLESSLSMQFASPSAPSEQRKEGLEARQASTAQARQADQQKEELSANENKSMFPLWPQTNM